MKTRREFLKNAGLFALAGTLIPKAVAAPMTKPIKNPRYLCYQFRVTHEWLDQVWGPCVQSMVPRLTFLEEYRKLAHDILNLPYEFDMFQYNVLPSVIDGHMIVQISGVGTPETTKHLDLESHYELGRIKHFDAINRLINNPQKYIQEKYLTKPLDTRVELMCVSWNDKNFINFTNRNSLRPHSITLQGSSECVLDSRHK